MKHCLALLLLLPTLPSCIAAIGNRGNTTDMPALAEPLLREKVASAQHIVTLREQQVSNLSELFKSGRADAAVVDAAQIELEQAKLTLADCKIALLAVEGNDHH